MTIFRETRAFAGMLQFEERYTLSMPWKSAKMANGTPFFVLDAPKPLSLAFAPVKRSWSLGSKNDDDGIMAMWTWEDIVPLKEDPKRALEVLIFKLTLSAGRLSDSPGEFWMNEGFRKQGVAFAHVAEALALAIGDAQLARNAVDARAAASEQD